MEWIQYIGMKCWLLWQKQHQLNEVMGHLQAHYIYLCCDPHESHGCSVELIQSKSKPWMATHFHLSLLECKSIIVFLKFLWTTIKLLNNKLWKCSTAKADLWGKTWLPSSRVNVIKDLSDHTDLLVSHIYSVVQFTIWHDHLTLSRNQKTHTNEF